MRLPISTLTLIAFATALPACDAVREGMEGHLDTVAQANGFRLTIDHAASLIARGNPRLAPTSNRIADPVAEAWVNFTLLASQMGSPDGVEGTDIARAGQREHDQLLVWKLHEDVIMARTQPFNPASAAPGDENVELRARHIVVRVPSGASAAEVDSLRNHAEDLRQRLIEGADFNDLALRFSEDPSSAPAGGTLGWIRRGQLLQELEGVIFSAEIGAISEPVRSPAGFHIIQVTDRRAAGSVQTQTQAALMERDRRVRRYENTYIDSLSAAAAPRYTHGATRVMRRLANDPRIERLSKARRTAPLVKFRGGSVTVGELADWIIVGAPNTRSTIAGADDAGLLNILDEMTRSKLLVKAARDLGYSLSPAEQDSVRNVAQRQIRAAATVSGLLAERLTSDEAIRQAVDNLIIELLNGERSTKAVDRVYGALRSGQTYQFYPDRFPCVGKELAILRRDPLPRGCRKDGRS